MKSNRPEAENRKEDDDGDQWGVANMYRPRFWVSGVVTEGVPVAGPRAQR